MRRTVREATSADDQACARIYRPYVIDTAITFELDPPTPEQMSARIKAALRTYDWLVVVDPSLPEDRQVIGYAYGSEFKSRAAYRRACEVSVYLEIGRRRTGAGRLLYQALFERLAARGYRTAVAGMTLPNEASEGLHRAMGFEPVGTYRRIGWKHGAWHDVAWMQRTLLEADGTPADPS